MIDREFAGHGAPSINSIQRSPKSTSNSNNNQKDAYSETMTPNVTPRVAAHIGGTMSDESLSRANVDAITSIRQRKSSADFAREPSADLEAPVVVLKGASTKSSTLESTEEPFDGPSSSKSLCGQLCDRMREQYPLEKELFVNHGAWKVILFASVFQYIHSIGTNLVYYLHVPAEPLKDLGFALFSPALTDDDQFVSEIIFILLALITSGFVVSPFFFTSKPRTFATVMAVRYARALVMAQTLRMITFLGTILPSPNFHCRPDSPDYDPPENFQEIIFRVDGVTGCGDLVFSSHTIFVTLGGLLIQHYSKNTYLKVLTWALVITLGALVIAARKHYTVDVIVAWYTCPLLWFFVWKTFPDEVPRSIAERAHNSEAEVVEPLVQALVPETPITKERSERFSLQEPPPSPHLGEAQMCSQNFA